jgi:phenylacetate-CoA ligase
VNSHINADNVLVEILDDDKPVGSGVIGEIVATNLNNYAMPLVRFRLGDTAQTSDERCPCGRGLPMMSHLAGRVYEIITLPNGTRVHGSLINHMLYGLPGVRQYQLVQETPNRITCRIVRAPDFSRDVVSRVRADIRKYLGPEVEVVFQFPERIEPSPSGKHQFIYSKVKTRPAANGARR